MCELAIHVRTMLTLLSYIASYYRELYYTDLKLSVLYGEPDLQYTDKIMKILKQHFYYMCTHYHRYMRVYVATTASCKPFLEFYS